MQTCFHNAGRIFVFAAACATSALAGTGADPAGVWLDEKGRGAIEIKPCGKALCGHVVWLKDTADPKGCGLQVIGEAVQTAPSTWDKGWIFSPEQRKNFDVELKPLSNGTLQVTGYAGVKLFSQTMIWTRAPADLKRCGEETAASTPPPSDKDIREKDLDLKAGTTPVLPPPVPPSQRDAAQSEQPKVSPPSDPAPSGGQNSDRAEPEVKQPAKAATANANPSPQEAPQVSSALPAPAEKETYAPQPKPPAARDAAKRRQAEAQSAEDEERRETPGQRSRKKHVRVSSINIAGIFTRSRSGHCKVDLPWVKVHFHCNK